MKKILEIGIAACKSRGGNVNDYLEGLLADIKNHKANFNDIYNDRSIQENVTVADDIEGAIYIKLIANIETMIEEVQQELKTKTQP